jgi:hypothetical protein
VAQVKPRCGKRTKDWQRRLIIEGLVLTLRALTPPAGC